MSDETAAKVDADTMNVVGRLLGMTPPYPGHPDDMEWGTTSLTVGKFRAIASALSEAKAQVEQLVGDVQAVSRDYTESAQRARVLEAALAKVPHLFGLAGMGGTGPTPNCPTICASLGGQCAFAALASPSEPAGGRKGE